VTGLEASATLVLAARDAERAQSYALGDATRLPLADGSFETVVAYNVLQTMTGVGDMARAVAEAARVLERGGHLCICVGHPMTDVDRVCGPMAENGDLRMTGSYFERRRVDDTVTKDGLTMTFHGWTYAIEDYVRAVEAAGLLLDRIREPRPTEAQLAERPSLERWRRVPLFLFLRAVKV
jgi:SAM-dependent methyltransferase